MYILVPQITIGVRLNIHYFVALSAMHKIEQLICASQPITYEMQECVRIKLE